ncbi:MAG: adenylate/guanylate cyclase domain-containing protein [Bacteroidales bacterium]|nr:adenylate/guanylate cyclase domain-containing protein [Bacteroidales bacterium]
MTPWIQEINLPAPYNEIPNETFYRDHGGTLFIGKSSGLNIIDGREFTYFHMDGPVYVCGDDSDTLYYVSQNDLGFILREEGHTFRAISRKHMLPTSHRNFTPSGIQNIAGETYIFSDIGRFLFSRSEIKYLGLHGDRIEETPGNKVQNQEFIKMIGDKIGIPSEGIRQIFIWNNSEIWILGAYTLHQIHDPSPLNLLEISDFNAGRILKSHIFNGRILLGTSRGIFSVSEDSALTGSWTIRKLLPGSSPSVHLFSTIRDRAFAAGSDGLYHISGMEATLIDPGSFTGIQAVKEESVIASGKQGTVRYTLDQGVWKSTPLDPSLKNSHSFIEYKDIPFFICNNSVFRINARADRIVPVSFHSEDLLYKLVQVEEALFLVSSQQVYSYDSNEETFQPLPANHRSRLLAESDMILPATGGNFWILQNNADYLSPVLYTGDLDAPVSSFAAFPVMQLLGEVMDMAYEDSVLFLTGKDKISLFDLHSLGSMSAEISISLLESEDLVNGERFHFSGLELQHLPEALFRYRVVPGNTSWSRWSSSRDYTVSDIKHGRYSMEVQAMDLYGRISDTAKSAFNIAPPFYASWYAYTAYGIFVLILLFLFQKWRLLSYRRAESRISERMEAKIQNLAAEKEISDKLVAEILTKDTADQIKNQGKAKWRKYERATVLFSDIQGFTKIAEEMNPEKLIDELDTFFFHFDSVVEKYNIEKIKTIGDAYMAAGGIPKKNSTNPVEVVLAALEMQTYMQQLKSTRAKIWDLRIGIHTGPVIAGVVGHKKLSYDIWGDTVNTASRMESSGTPGKINISGMTYSMVKDFFICEYRGKLPVKYKGNIDMYYVSGLRPELSVDLKGIPNKRFFTKLQLLRLGDLEEMVFDDILKRLPETLHFHSLEYARRVYNQSFLLCRSEEIEQEDRLLVRTAALMLLTGLTQDYLNFENRSSVISREILPDFSYSEGQIDQICNLILATKRPFKPNNRLEKILIDAKMEYLGRPDYSDQIKLLYQELRKTGSKINGQQFKKQQLELLFEFQFYTVAAKRMREVSGNEQMSILEQERWI